jgi:Brp/Blh family beta-carotene 15,15'-monooxygenase
MGVTSGVRTALVRWVVYPSWVLVGLTAAVFAALAVVPTARAVVASSTPRPPAWQYVPLVASVLLFGLPHGAVDHLTLPRAAGRPVTRRSLAGVGLLYLVLGSAFFAAWFLAPAAAFLLFLALTWFHWGQGDRWLLFALASDAADAAPPTRLRSALTVVVRGGLPMVVPLVAFPDAYRRVAALVVGRFESGVVARLDPLFLPEVRAALGGGLAVVALASLALGLRADDATWRYDAVETPLLAVYFAVVPPVLAVGVYFALWHSVRHVVRLVALDSVGRAALDANRVAPAVAGFARDAAPLTLGALALLAGAAAVVPASPGGVAEFAGVYLALLAALTLPHTVVVTLLDRVQGVA